MVIDDRYVLASARAWRGRASKLENQNKNQIEDQVSESESGWCIKIEIRIRLHGLANHNQVGVEIRIVSESESGWCIRIEIRIRLANQNRNQNQVNESESGSRIRIEIRISF